MPRVLHRGRPAFFRELGYEPGTFFREQATAANWFDFWDMWAVPREQCSRLQSIVSEVMADLAAGGDDSRREGETAAMTPAPLHI